LQKDKQFFSFNKPRDFLKCSLIDMVVNEDGCMLDKTKSSNKGTMILKPLDSFEKGMEWDRIKITAQVPKECKITGYFVASEDVELYKDIRNPMVHELAKIELLSKHNPITVQNPSDALLHTLRGRYLFGWLSIYAADESPQINKIRVYYPKKSLMDYLPEVYRNSEHADFLHRYLSIYQSILMDLEEEIDISPLHLLSKVGSEEDVWWMAETLGLESPEIWDCIKLRDRVSKALELSRMRGTRKSVEEISKFITDIDCFIIEQHDLGRKKADSHLNQLYDKLYGSHPNDFSILVPGDGLASERKYNQMKKALDSVKPAYTSARLVSLQPYLRLDQHAYIGINSCINKPGNLVLDNRSALPYNTVLVGRAERKMLNEE